MSYFAGLKPENTPQKISGKVQHSDEVLKAQAQRCILANRLGRFYRLPLFIWKRAQEGHEMKHNYKKFLTGFLLFLTVIVFGWAILLLISGVPMIESFHMAVPGSPQYDKMLWDVCASVQILLLFAVLPLLALSVFLLVAFLLERKKNRQFERQLRQQ